VDPQQMRAKVTSSRVARLATVDAAGRPHLVPITFVLLGEVVYHAVDQKPKRSARLRRIANLTATGHASILVDGYAEDWSTLWWIRLDGQGRVVADPAEANRAVTALVDKYPQYAATPPAGPVIAVDVGNWSGWRASGTEV
jgi:PPOX class probable F420-dependent enzyme